MMQERDALSARLDAVTAALEIAERNSRVRAGDAPPPWYLCIICDQPSDGETVDHAPDCPFAILAADQTPPHGTPCAAWTVLSGRCWRTRRTAATTARSYCCETHGATAVRRTVISAEWAAQLGHDAQRRGFVPGAVVDIVLSVVPGVIMLTLAEDIDR